MSLPWMKFSPSAWRGDQALRAVSVAARGLWIECLCIMHEAKPYGHLVLNGEPVDGDTLARMTGVSVDEATALMAELRKAGVLSMTGKGVVFSRRMTKDHARAQKGKKAANKRWSQAAETADETAEPNGSPNREPSAKKLDAESKDKKVNPHEPPTGAAGDLFDDLWKTFPHNAQSVKSTAMKAFDKLCADEQKQLLANGNRYLAWWIEDCSARKQLQEDRLRYVPHLSTWINTGAWREAASLPVKVTQLRAVADEVEYVDRFQDEPLFKACEQRRGKPVPSSMSRYGFPKQLVEQCRGAA